MTEKRARVGGGTLSNVRRAMRARVALSWIAAAVPALAASAEAQMLCTTPDNFCTGDPCVTRKVEVVSPCTLDFGTRTLVIGGVFKIPDGGTLSIHAGSIRVESPILGRHTTQKDGSGSMIELTADADIAISRRVDVSARAVPGGITLTAGGNIELDAPVRAKTKGKSATSPGGTVEATAGGSLISLGGGRVEVAGGASSAGGIIAMSGKTKMDLRGRIDARGSDGGQVDLTSADGTVVVRRKIEVDGRKGAGGAVGVIAKQGVTFKKKLLATGRTTGGTVTVSAASAEFQGFVRARGRGGTGGTVDITTVGDATVQQDVTASGISGGSVHLTSTTADVQVNGALDTRGKTGSGGDVQLSAGGHVFLNDVIDSNGGSSGGTVGIHGTTLVTFTRRSDVLAGGDVGGTVSVTGGSAVIESGSDVDLDGDTAGGELRIRSTGDLVLSGGFRARGDQGGVIEAQATGNVTADGIFQSNNAGCTGLSAGGSLDTTGGTFDMTVAASCP